VLRRFGQLRFGLGRIAAVQNRALYDQGVGIAALVAEASRNGGGHGPPIAGLPDIAWTVSGFGTARVATATVRGHQITIRLGSRLGEEQVWLVDVDNHLACGRFGSRSDAMSKYGVALALKARRSRAS
jgi:hypothetical protein